MLLPPTIKQLLKSSAQIKNDQIISISRVTVHGWLETLRHQKTHSFLQLNDGSCRQGLQAVINNDLKCFSEEVAASLTTGACVSLSGELRKLEGRRQQLELAVQDIKVLGEADPNTYPLHKGRLPLDLLRQYPHLRSRAKTFASIWRMRDGLIKSMHDFFTNHSFILTHPPIITGNDCEGAGEAFQIVAPSKPQFFKRPAYATVSSQLHLEFLASSLSRVYSISPCFRAEPSNSTRHLAEFWMLEAEMAFLTESEKLLDLIEGQTKHSLAYMLNNHSADLEFFDEFVEKGLVEKLKRYSSQPFERVTYQEAISLLSQVKEKTWKFPVEMGLPLQSEHEKYLAEQIFNGPVFVTHYPAEMKPFYMKRDANSNAICTDLLFPKWGEVVGGSLREDSYTKLKENMILSNLKLEEYEWYLDLRRWGACPTGGYGLGVERLLGIITGIANIRDLIPVPNYLSHLPL